MTRRELLGVFLGSPGLVCVGCVTAPVAQPRYSAQYMAYMARRRDMEAWALAQRHTHQVSLPNSAHTHTHECDDDAA